MMATLAFNVLGNSSKQLKKKKKDDISVQNLFKVSSKDTRKQAYLVHIPIVCFEQVIA